MRISPSVIAWAGMAAVATAMVAGCAGSNNGRAAPATSITTSMTPSPPTTATTSVAPATTVSPTTRPAAPTTVRTTAPRTGGTPVSTPECRTQDLAGSRTRGGESLGAYVVTIRFTNIGSRTCYVAGYPRTSYVDAQGREIVSAAHPADTVAKVILARGGAATVNVWWWPASVTPDPAHCEPTGAAGLRIYPPDQTTSIFVPNEATICAGKLASPQLYVTPLIAEAGA